MSYAWTGPAFKQALVTQVNAISALQALRPKVRVLDYAPSIDEPLTDVISVGYEIADDNEVVVLGNQRYDEVVTVECGIRVVRPGAGASPANDAEDRAVTLLAHVTDHVHQGAPKVGDQTLRARVTNRRFEGYPYQAKTMAVRVASIEFSIVYTARTSPT